jgi:hypothetical protein
MAYRKRKQPSYKQPQKYDSSFKDWISQQAQDILPLLVPGVKYEQTLNVEIIRSPMRADKVFKVLYCGEEHVLHIEFEAGEDGQLPSRLLVYNSVLYRDHQLPVLTIVIYPFRVEMAVPPLVIANREKEILKFDFQTLSLFTMDAGTYVEHHWTCMYPLLVTMRGVHADLITQVLNELSELYRNDEVTLAQQYVWMQLLLERTDTIQPLEKDKIKERLAMFDKLWEESPTIQKMREQMREQFRSQYYEEGMNKGMAQGMAQGEVKALRRTLVDVVRIKFPDLTKFAQKQVKLFNKADVLEMLFQKMLTAPDATMARQLLESPPEQQM